MVKQRVKIVGRTRLSRPRQSHVALMAVQEQPARNPLHNHTYPNLFLHRYTMAPLVQALQVSFQSKSVDGTFHYHCELNPTWSVIA